ncbi:TatD family hydrolase [Candidatus Woesearchaeota archaeon]|nr:TatD family hydrolase [Candidatus Woesearchaeota archaeon]
MVLVDIHAHLDHHAIYKDIDAIISRAKKAGVVAVVTNGINKETNRISLELARKHDIVKASLGIYPPDALDRECDVEGFELKPFDIDEEIEFMNSHPNDFISFGEVGLDLYNGKDVKMQKEILSKIMRLAIKQDKPIILHSRKAERELLEFLEDYKHKKIVLHCFSGRKHLIRSGVEKNYFFSVPTNIVKSDHFQRLVEMVPITRLLTETDAPYLSPYQDKLNEPAYVAETIKKIAEIKGMDAREVENNIYLNYKKLFE